jgi:uncharacterized protein YndB with AHSA1/START domain
MLGNSQSAESTSDREIVTSRTFDAPRERVFEAWSTPEAIAKWWGPRGFTTTTQAFEFEPGGTWRYVMHGPDGKDYANRVVYDEIVRPERIVFSHFGGVDGAHAQFQMTVTFTARGEKTDLVMRHVFKTGREREAVAQKYGAIEGAKQTLARLAEHLGGAGAPRLEMSRVFDAPRSLVFEAWTQAEHVSRWFAPRPLTIPRCEVDFRPGGAFRLAMRMPDGVEFPMDATFGEIVDGEKIVFRGVIHGGNAVETTVTFADVPGDEDKTRGAPQGWAATLEQLGEFAKTRG